MGTKEEIQIQIDELRKKLEDIEKKEKEEEERKQSLNETDNESHTIFEEGMSCLEVPNEDTGISTEEQRNEQEIRTLHNIGVQSWCPQTFNKREGISNDSGTMYEVKICCLIFLKLMKLDAKFFLCSNLKEAGDFDDVVVWYSYNLHNFPINETLFIQLKHSENKNKRSIGFFDFRPYFDIKKFFLSYCSVRDISNPDHPVFRSDPEDRTFIIYTNSDISGKKLPLVKYSSIPHILRELLLASDVSTLHLGEEDANIPRVLEYLKQNSVKHPSLEPYPDTTDTMWIVNCTKHKSFDTLKKHIRENETFDVNSYKDFISKTLICYNQMDISNLDASIKNELKHVLTISPEETDRAFRLLVESVKTWRGKESYYLDENCPLWAGIVRDIHRFRFNSRRNELLSLGVRYKQEEVTRLQKELSQDCRVYSVECSSKLTTATTLKVLQVLEYKGESYVLVTSEQYVENEKLVLKTWLNKLCSTLIIEITSKYMLNDEFIGNLYKALTKCTMSCLVTIVPRHNDTIAKVFQNTALTCKRVIDSLAFNQLDRESQNRITSKKFNFQGQPVSLTDILKTEALEKSPQNVLSRLFFDNDVTIGRDISEFEMTNYIPRYLEIPHISKDILYQNNGDVIALETITQQISTTNFRNEEMGILSMQRKFISNITESLRNVDTENHVVLEHANEKSQFETLCKENTNVHWIKECNCQNETPRNKSENVYNTDKTGIKNRSGDYNNFIWKKSTGNISTVKRSLMKSGHCCYDELTFISHDLESPVLITGEPGIGKSCLLKNLAILIKQRFPTKWIVFVDLPQHCDFINTLKTVSEKDVDNILEKSLKLSDAGIDFWKETRSNFENCVILLDAYDEMSPHYAEKVKQIMRYLNTTSCFLYIATRRSTVADLENDLSVISYNVKLLNEEEGKRYFKEVMMSTSPISEEDADLFSRQVTEKYSGAMITGDTFLMSNPLHIKLLAEIYLDIIEENTDIFNIYQIYSAFLEKNVVQIYKKANSDINNPAIKNQLHFFIQQFHDYNKNISAEQMFPGEKCSTMDVVNAQNEISKMCEKVGVIDEIVDGKIKFVHRSFTDYFASLWLKENYKGHHALVIDVMCKIEYDMIKKFYDLSLSEDFPLHSAALSRDEDRIETLLSRGVDVNNTDKMQRTPLHLAASYNRVKEAQILLENSASIRLRDALDWTPTDYAIQTYSWETLDLFLGTQGYEETEKMEISKRIFQIWRKNIQHHEKPNQLFNEEEYQETLILEKFDVLYICLSKGLVHLLENISEFVQSSNKIIKLNQVIAPHRILDIENSSNVESSKTMEYIPLHVAARCDQLVLVSQLIEKYQCDIDIVDNEGKTALIIACIRGNIDIVKYLLNHDADIPIKTHNRNNALIYACQYGHLDIVKYCIQHGANIHARDSERLNLLVYACKGDNLDIIRYCVEQGADINCLDKTGRNLLMYACYFGHLDIVKFCLEKGLDINHVNEDGTNGLMCACTAGNLDIVKYCIQHGANIHTRDNNGWNLLFYARQLGDLDIIRYCVENGANINYLYKSGDNLLMDACFFGHIDIVEFCLEKGLDINGVNEGGENGLMRACYNGHLDIVKYCIQHGANLHTRDNNGWNLLFYACKGSNLDIIRYCVEQGADINCLDKTGRNLSMHACYFGHLDIVEFCLEKGLDINHVNEYGANGLMRACKAGHLDIVKCCIQHGANTHTRDNNGWNLLFYACKGGNLDIIRYCVEQGADINCLDKTGRNLLMHACYFGHLDIVEFCLEKGLDINHVSEYGANGLMRACKTGHLDIVKCCTQHGANIHTRDSEGRNLLFFACKGGNLDIIRYCVEQGADINCLDKTGRNLLMHACYFGHLDIVEFCLEKGLDINHVNEDGTNGLMWACTAGHLDIVKYCIQHGANIHTRNNNGRNLLFYAREDGNLDIIRYCVEQGADINCLDKTGRNLLMHACYFGHLDIVEFCLEKGLDINHVNEYEANGLMMACKAGHLDIVKCCIQHGANTHTRDDIGWNLLFYACEGGDSVIIRYCVEQGADINCLDKTGRNLLMHACYFGNLDIVEFCLEKGLDINHVNEYGANGLMRACKAGHLDIVKCCIQHGANTHTRDNNGWNLLFYACEGGDSDIIRYCVEQGADMNCLDKTGSNLLMHACYFGHLDIVEFCLEKGLDINDVNEYGANGLMRACKAGHLDIVKCCIQHGANTHTRDNNGWNLLFYACEGGDPDVIRYCVEQGVDINCLDKTGSNLLMHACYFDHLDIVKFCLEKGLDINHVNEDGANGLMRACKAGHLDIVKCCTQHGANIHTRDNNGWNLLFYACEGGDSDIIRYCVEQGADINCLDKTGRNLLMYACYFGHLDIVKFCLEKGLDINHVNEDGTNGLMCACTAGHLDIVKSCIQHGANIHTRDSEGWNLLFHACKEGHFDIIRYCVEQGADVYGENLFGYDILLIATEAGHFASFEYILNLNFERESLYKSFEIACSEYKLEFVKLLTKKCRDMLCDSECLAVLFHSAYEGLFDIVQYCLEEGVDVNATLDCTCSLLLAAVEGRQFDIVRYLVNNGANVNYIYADGYTALLVASEAGHLDIVKYLVEQGADVNHTSNKHETALMVSVENGHKDIVEYLLDQYSNILHDLHSCVCALLSACRLLQPDIALICLDYMERKKVITSNLILFAALPIMKSYFDILYKYSCHYTSLCNKNRLSYECILHTFEESYFYMLSTFWDRYCIERDRGALLKGGKIVLKML